MKIKKNLKNLDLLFLCQNSKYVSHISLLETGSSTTLAETIIPTSHILK
jgi:hypothetical protein